MGDRGREREIERRQRGDRELDREREGERDRKRGREGEREILGSVVHILTRG